MSRIKFFPKHALSIAMLLCVGVSAHAQQNQSMEERLRAQLRVTTTQLQQAQNELAQLKAGGSTAAAPAKAANAANAGSDSADVESLRSQLAQSRAQASSERQAREKKDGDIALLQTQAQAVVEKANAQIAQYKSAYDELLKMARASESDRQRLGADATLRKTSVEQCEAKNAQLYSVGQEVLRAYESLEMGDVMSARQPFAAKTRVRYEEIAQQYGDRLYEGKFDARSVTLPSAPDVPANSNAPK